MSETTPTAETSAPSPELETPQAPPALPTVTSASEWRRRARALYLVTLPSGVTVKARRTDFGRLIRQGIVDPVSIAPQDGDTPRQRTERLLPPAKAAAPYLIVEPPVAIPNGGTTPHGEDVMSVEDIDEMDLISIFLWAGGWTPNEALRAIEVDG